MIKGDKFNHKFQVTESVYNRFIGLFNDKNPLHTDKDFARGKGFKDVVMHGNILNGFISYFAGELLPLKNIVIQTQEIKYFHPVYLDDVLDFEAEVVDFFESVNSVEIKYFFENSARLKVAKGKVFIGII